MYIMQSGGLVHLAIEFLIFLGDSSLIPFENGKKKKPNLNKIN